MEPLIAYKIFTSIERLTRGLSTLTEKCVVGIVANRDLSHSLVENSIGIITNLVPRLGYELCAQIAKKAQKTGGSVYEIVLEEGHLSKEELDQLLSPEML